MTMKVYPDGTDRREGWRVPQQISGFVGQFRLVLWSLALVGGAMTVFIAWDNPLNRFTKLEAQIASDKLEADIKIATVQQTLLTDETERKSLRGMVETMLVLECLRPGRRSDLQKAQVPCARLFSDHGIDTR